MHTKSVVNLTKEFKFEGYPAAVGFVSQIVPLAEEADHHPDIFIHSYNRVKIMMHTHTEDKITPDVAGKILVGPAGVCWDIFRLEHASSKRNYQRIFLTPGFTSRRTRRARRYKPKPFR